MSHRSLAARLRSRARLFAVWTSLGHPSITEIFTTFGADFVGIDLEHSTISQEQAEQIIASAQAGQTACLPRLSSHNSEQLRRLLDSGADGVIVPNVTSPREVDRLVEWCQYPPVGKRSYGVARAHGYGVRFEEYASTWNERCAIVIQIESAQSAEAADDLVAHDAVDGAMVGPYDISGSLGLPGQLSHPLVTRAAEQVIRACQHHQKACGTQIVEPTEENVRTALEMGYTFVVLASDVFILWKWSERMQKLVGTLRAQAGYGARKARALRR